MMTSHREGKISVSLTNGQHWIVSDVAHSLGGEDAGLNPHELVEGALAACTSLTLELYAKRKNWEIIDLSVEVKIVKEGTDTLIERKINFGDIPEDQKTRLLEIADKCPVHKLLVSNIKIQNA